jgi:tubulin--tyrosine ligase
MRKIKVLVGIDEVYTNKKIIDCFKYRSDYEVTLFDRDNIEQQQLLKENPIAYDIYWLEYEDLNFEKLVNLSQQSHHLERILCNSYCIRKGLIRKAQLAFYLKKYLAKRTDSVLAKFLPATYIFELDYLDYIEESLNDVYEVEHALRENIQKKSCGDKTKKFILKSSMTNKGKI